jgi:hypothetical protein
MFDPASCICAPVKSSSHHQEGKCEDGQRVAHRMGWFQIWWTESGQSPKWTIANSFHLHHFIRIHTAQLLDHRGRGITRTVIVRSKIGKSRSIHSIINWGCILFSKWYTYSPVIAGLYHICIRLDSIYHAYIYIYTVYIRRYYRSCQGLQLPQHTWNQNKLHFRCLKSRCPFLGGFHPCFEDPVGPSAFHPGRWLAVCVPRPWGANVFAAASFAIPWRHGLNSVLWGTILQALAKYPLVN